MSRTATNVRAISIVRAENPQPEPAVKKAPIRRTNWTPDETAKVIRHAHELMAEAPRMPMHVAARRAQEYTLEPARWKKIKQHKDVERWLTPLPATISQPPSPQPIPRRKHRAILPPLGTPVVDESVAAPVPAPIPESLPVPAKAPAVDPALVRAVAEHLLPAFAATLSECASQLVSALADAIRSAASQPAASLPVAPAHPLPPAPPRTRLPRVCVVGLLNQQENDVRGAFANAIEFVFVKAQKTGGSGDGGAGMLTRSASSDLVIAMTDFIGHDVEHCAKKLHVPYERINGSVSALKRWLREWLDTGVRRDH